MSRFMPNSGLRASEQAWTPLPLHLSGPTRTWVCSTVIEAAGDTQRWTGRAIWRVTPAAPVAKLQVTTSSAALSWLQGARSRRHVPIRRCPCLSNFPSAASRPPCLSPWCLSLRASWTLGLTSQISLQAYPSAHPRRRASFHPRCAHAAPRALPAPCGGNVPLPARALGRMLQQGRAS